jgi:hypothetical protein
MEVSGWLHAPAALHPGKAPGAHCMDGWESLRDHLDTLGQRQLQTAPSAMWRTDRLSESGTCHGTRVHVCT